MNIIHLLHSHVAAATGFAGVGFGSDIIQMFLDAGLVVKLVMFILIGFSIACWAIIFIKLRFFRYARLETAYFLEIFWEATELTGIYKESKDLFYSPVAQMFIRGYTELIRLKKLKGNGGSLGNVNGVSEAVERALRRANIHESSRMEKALAFLATTGNAAPFIGLFGTVWGIMESFRGIGIKGSASLAVVAPGISEALIATAVGLFAAIPAVIAYNFFNSKAAALGTEMETFSADFLSIVVRQSMKGSLDKVEE
ncbi:MAG: protein TolQ [Deltaproteobacteria bacterium]|nr:protein TolQ [Deltaproteobacteria bacterium]